MKQASSYLWLSIAAFTLLAVAHVPLEAGQLQTYIVLYQGNSFLGCRGRDCRGGGTAAVRL